MLPPLFAVRRLLHQHDHVLEEGVFVLPVDVKNGLLFGQVVRERQDLDRLDVRELAPEDGRDVLVHHKSVVDHGVHFGVAEEDGEVVAENLFELHRLELVVGGVVVDFGEFVFDDDF